MPSAFNIVPIRPLIGEETFWVLRSYTHQEIADIPACSDRDNPGQARSPLNYSLCFVHLVSFVQPKNQIDQIDQIDETDQRDETDQTDQVTVFLRWLDHFLEVVDRAYEALL